MKPTASEKLASAIEALRRCEERSMAGLFALEVMHGIRNPLDALGSLVDLAADAPSLSLAHEYRRAMRRLLPQSTWSVWRRPRFVFTIEELRPCRFN